MSPPSQKYTLVGFSPDLDWRPLNFIKPLPPNRICSACGLVRNMIALLPCMHVLCDSCYKQCTKEGMHVCPFDGYEWDNEDVDWKDFRVDELLKREVKCWNEKSGCQYVASASEIVQHFQRKCEHHCVSCPKCSATVPCSGVIGHLKSGLCDPAASIASKTEKLFENSSEAALATPFEGAVEKHAGEIREFLWRIEGDISAHGDKLNEISQAINTLKETQRAEVSVGQVGQLQDCLTQILCHTIASNEKLEVFTRRIDTLNLPGRIGCLEKTMRDGFSNAAIQTGDNISQVATAVQGVKAEVNQANKAALDHIKSILQHAKLNVGVCLFFVKNVKELKRTAMDEGVATFESEQVYLRGYCISPGVQVEWQDESLKLFARLRLHKGDMDDLLPWPFEHDINLSVMHPKDEEDRVLEVKTWRSAKSFQKPTRQSRDSSVCIRGDSLNLNRLIREGYVADDQLRVKLELCE